MSQTSETSSSSLRLPSAEILKHAAKLGIVEDRPIMLDYWNSSLSKDVLIGVRESGEKLLVKSEEEYTSSIERMFKLDGEYIIMTENSIYLTSADIPTKRIA